MLHDKWLHSSHGAWSRALGQEEKEPGREEMKLLSSSCLRVPGFLNPFDLPIYFSGDTIPLAQEHNPKYMQRDCLLN